MPVAGNCGERRLTVSCPFPCIPVYLPVTTSLLGFEALFGLLAANRQVPHEDFNILTCWLNLIAYAIFIQESLFLLWYSNHHTSLCSLYFLLTDSKIRGLMARIGNAPSSLLGDFTLLSNSACDGFASASACYACASIYASKIERWRMIVKFVTVFCYFLRRTEVCNISIPYWLGDDL